MSDTGFYLFDNQNSNAPVRSNGRRFWGYPTRNGGVAPTVIVVHTAENVPDVIPPDTGAESVAGYFDSNVRPASAHHVCDSDSHIPLLPDTAVAFHVRGYNTISVGIEIATQARAWSTVPDWHAVRLLRNAAAKCAEWALLWDIPVRYLTRAQVDAGESGFTGHTDLDPDRRSDPGFTQAQWQQFLELVNEQKGDDMCVNTLRKGHTGNAVAGWQKALNNWLAWLADHLDDPAFLDDQIEATGTFDSATEALVIRYQKAADLPVPNGEIDGVTGTWLHEYRVDKADTPPTSGNSRPLKTETVSFDVVVGYDE